MSKEDRKALNRTKMKKVYVQQHQWLGDLLWKDKKRISNIVINRGVDGTTKRGHARTT
ncbi:hypothetical protein DPMN_167750 [Dreissena polymorpha]|uniref:Uncharacterized protein n=1 Tax=Dreissena polymorpha TaxID=45954 RepID=A0A9D4F200_DREPO|nr:hypothetical protein DPMN_167750 [Dreissena polymorpha]